MSSDLKLEVYASDRNVPMVEFHTYSLKTTNIDESPIKVIRGACKKLANYNKANGIFENGKKIYSVDEIANIPKDADFTIVYEGKQLLDFQGNNKRVYEGYIAQLIKKQLAKVMIYDKYQKYSTRYDISSSWFMSANGNWGACKSEDKIFQLERSYSIKVDIDDEGKAYLWINTGSNFRTRYNVMDLIDKGEAVLGLEVKNEWGSFKQTGTIVEVSNKTVSETIEFGSSLKDYYIERGEEYRVKDIADDTPVIMVQAKGGKIISYYPQALRPIITRERIGNLAPEFSVKIENLVKREMRARLTTDQDFIHDIGSIEELGGLLFMDTCCEPEALSFNKKNIALPRLTCGDGRTIACGEEFKIFGHGFYQKSKANLKLGFVYPRGKWELLSQVVNDIYYFAVKGEYHKERDTYTKENLLDIQTGSMFKQEYDIGDITDYKRAARAIQKEGPVDIVIALVPDSADDENPYDPFKKTWAELNIPSQMITMKTARKFVEDAKRGPKATGSKWYLQNIVLGILGKTGGIPWVVKEMPGDVDCFVGLDVATINKGIHVPACSVVFD